MEHLRGSVSRRTLLRLGVIGGATAGLAAAGSPAVAATDGWAERQDAIRRRLRTGRTSLNGWPIENGADIGGAVWTRQVIGTEATAAVHVGAPEAVLLDVARRFHYSIGELRAGEAVGFRRTGPRVRGHETNHGSGTAIDLRPGWYPAGTRGAFGPAELAVLRGILTEYDGVVAWGGDFAIAQESHFEIAVGPDDPRLVALHARLTMRRDAPGPGPGARLVL